jgi:hypothetical protein
MHPLILGGSTMPAGYESHPPDSPGPRGVARYEVVASSVYGHPRGTILHPHEIEVIERVIPWLLESGAIRPVQD